MANYAKHEGKNISDGNGVIILYSMIEPTNPFYDKTDYEHCLVYKMGSISPAYETTMLQYVRSVEGQNAKNVGDVLNKYTLSSEFPVSILQYLKNMGKLHLVPVEEIMVVLNSSMAFPLKNLVEIERQKKENELNGSVSASVDSPAMEVIDPEQISDIDELETILAVKQEEVNKIKERIEQLKKC